MSKAKYFICNNWLIGLLLFVLVVDISLRISSSTITRESIVIAFIGVLATFVVIGNYTQVQGIKKEMLSEIKNIKKISQRINYMTENRDWVVAEFIEKIWKKAEDKEEVKVIKTDNKELTVLFIRREIESNWVYYYKENPKEKSIKNPEQLSPKYIKEIRKVTDLKGKTIYEQEPNK